MYCRNCGKELNEESGYCTGCGIPIGDYKPQAACNDRPRFGWSLLSFLFPIVGLILFLTNENKKPKMAKSAGKCALAGVITEVVLFIAVIILCVVFTVNLPVDDTQTLLQEYVDVNFGEITISDSEDYSVAILEVIVKNKADQEYSYTISIEATDADGVRIEDRYTVYADYLDAGQSMRTTITFICYSQKDIEQIKNATFNIVDVHKFNY